jgi:O-antigen/teichoic acid export membrane protein
VRLFRRNVLGVYAVYGASIGSGLVVTPIVLRALGDETFGLWSFIGSVTIYLAVLDLGLGPSVVRFTAEARGRNAPEETNEIASVALALYAAIGVVTLVTGVALSWLVPVLIDTPDGLVGEARLATFLVTVSLAARFPLGLFYNLLGGHQRLDVQNLGNFVSIVLYAVFVAILIPRGGGLVLMGALTLGVTLVRLGLPLLWLRGEFPLLRLRRDYVTRARVHELAHVSWSNFLVHVANKVVFSTDIVVVGIVLGAREAASYAIAARLFELAFGLASVLTSVLYPAFAEYEGAGQAARQQRLLLSGLRGGSAAALLLALPLLAIPEQLVTGWLGAGYGDSAPVLALLALVVLLHQPIWLLTQYLIARGRQKEIARLLIAAAGANVILSVVLATTIGTWGVALATLLAEVAVLALALPLWVFRAVGLRTRGVARALVRPALPACAVAALVFGVARQVDADTLLELVPVGAAWLVLASAAVWRLGLSADDRRFFSQQARSRGGTAAAASPLVEPS